MDNLWAQHRERIKVRNKALGILLDKEKNESAADVASIDKKWPKAESRGLVAKKHNATLLYVLGPFRLRDSTRSRVVLTDP